MGVRSNPLLCSAEITYMGLLSRAIDNFLFAEDVNEGASFHQFPTRIRDKKIDKADILVVSLPDLI